MEDSVKQRLKKFLKDNKIKGVDFCEIIGVSSGFIAGMRESIQPDKLKSIAINYPILDIGWLMTGEGRMLKSVTNENNTSSINVDGDLKIIEMENKLKKTEALLDAMIEQNERLKAELAEYKAKEALSKGIA